MSAVWSSITGFFADALAFLEGVFSFTGDASWGWAIIALTLITRILLLPLNIKQTRSMRKMQEVGPKVKAIQKKYKVDRELMRTNPEKYRMMKQKANEETMALYKEEGVNPAGGCLPLIAQMPVFFALFSVLRSHTNLALAQAPFYFFTSSVEPVKILLEDGQAAPAGYEVGVRTLENGTVERFVDGLIGGLGGPTSTAGLAGIALIIAMGVTMFITQRQMMGRNSATADPAQQQQQKIMMYVMPVFLAFISFNLPLGVLLYWVTTNIWQLVQQQIMFRDMQTQATTAPVSTSNRGKGTGTPGARTSVKDDDTSSKPSGRKNAADDTQNAAAGDHAARKSQKTQDADTSSTRKKRNKRRLPGGN